MGLDSQPARLIYLWSSLPGKVWSLVLEAEPQVRPGTHYTKVLWAYGWNHAKILSRDDVIKWKHFRVTGPLCWEFTGPGEFPTQRPVTRSFDVFFDLRLNKRLSKQPWGWWFETPSWSLWRQCNVIYSILYQWYSQHICGNMYKISVFIQKLACEFIKRLWNMSNYYAVPDIKIIPLSTTGIILSKLKNPHSRPKWQHMKFVNQLLCVIFWCLSKLPIFWTSHCWVYSEI